MNIGIIITTFMRDELLFKSIQSILDNMQDNFKIIVVDQGNNIKQMEKSPYIHYYQVPFNSGLSYCRNFGVQKAKELNCDYTIIGSDSFLFNKSIQKIEDIIDSMKLYNFQKIGFELTNCICDWEAKLNLIEGQYFELDFIPKVTVGGEIEIHNCDIVRNFFIATTNSLLDAKWDENLKLCEHEDQAWLYKQKGYKTGWTDYIWAEKMTDRPNEYKRFRDKNFQEGREYLKKKYNITGWVRYVNIERAKRAK